jgi:Protein of unknown function (DUF1583)
MTSLLSLALSLAVGTQPQTNILDLDFRGGQFRETVLNLSGPNARKYITPEVEGLRITIPLVEEPLAQVGVVSKLAVLGDFEITVSYEILYAAPPTKNSYGVGVNLIIATDTPVKDSATIARRTHPAKGNVYATNRSFKNPEREDVHSVKFFPTEVSKGMLRLVREGSTLTFCAKEPEDHTFRELRRVTFVDQPIANVRVTADPGKSLGELDVRIHSLLIHSGNLAASVPNTTSSGNSFIWLAMGGCCLLGCGVYLAWRTMRKGNGGEINTP